MDTIQLISGIDIPILELQTSIHQPSIKEISFIGETTYFLVLQLFSINKDMVIASNPQGASGLKSLSNFEIFMMLIRDPQMASKQQDILAVLSILFPDYTPQLLPRSIFCKSNSKEHSFTLDENTYDSFRTVVAQIGCLDNSISGQNGGFNPRGKKAAEIAAKLMRGRQRSAKGGSKNTGGILARYVSILTIAIPSMSLNDCLNLTIFQLYDLMERYSLHLNWDIDMRSRLAGAKPDKEPDDWMKNLH